MACEEVFVRKLRERGLRLTPQREMVLSALHATEGLATAEAIHAQVRTVASTVDVSTIYRTLELLQELDIVACIDTGDGERRYELLGVHGPHLHLVCRVCGAVSGIDLAEARPLAAQLREQHGFVADLAHLSISGLCASCAREA